MSGMCLKARCSVAANRIRVNVQLIDTENRQSPVGGALRQNQLPIFFDMQDEIVSRLSNTLKRAIDCGGKRGERERAAPTPTRLTCVSKAPLGSTWAEHSKTWHKRAASMNGALALEPGNVEALVGTALVDFGIGTNLLSDDRIERLTRSRSGRHKRRCPWHRTIPWLIASWASLKIFTNPRGSRHCRMRAGIDAGSEFGRGTREHRDCEVFILGRGAETEAHIEHAPPPSLPAIHSSISGPCLSVSPNFGRAPTPKRLFGCAGALRPTEITPGAHFNLAGPPWALVGELDEARATVQAGPCAQSEFHYPAGIALTPQVTIWCISRERERVY